jgi:hypothetical protein
MSQLPPERQENTKIGAGPTDPEEKYHCSKGAGFVQYWVRLDGYVNGNIA